MISSDDITSILRSYCLARDLGMANISIAISTTSVAVGFRECPAEYELFLTHVNSNVIKTNVTAGTTNIITFIIDDNFEIFMDDLKNKIPSIPKREIKPLRYRPDFGGSSSASSSPSVSPVISPPNNSPEDSTSTVFGNSPSSSFWKTPDESPSMVVSPPGEQHNSPPSPPKPMQQIQLPPSQPPTKSASKKGGCVVM